MKTVIGILMIVAAIVFGIWAGLVWAFIGGIVDIINALKADEIEAITIAIGVVKVMFAGLIGWASAMLLMLPGLALLNAKTSVRRRSPY